MDENELVTVISHLTSTEVPRVEKILHSLKIPFIKNGHDATNKYSSLYYLIRVEKKNFRIAKQGINKYKAQVFIESQKCPRCKSLGHKEIEKQGFWKKLYYMGTTLVRCNRCKEEFGI